MLQNQNGRAKLINSRRSLSLCPADCCMHSRHLPTCSGLVYGVGRCLLLAEPLVPAPPHPLPSPHPPRPIASRQLSHGPTQTLLVAGKYRGSRRIGSYRRFTYATILFLRPKTVFARLLYRCDTSPDHSNRLRHLPNMDEQPRKEIWSLLQFYQKTWIGLHYFLYASNWLPHEHCTLTI